MTPPLEPAFPRNNDAPGHNGMTLRDYFAAKAMQAMMSQPDWTTLSDEKVAVWAYAQADAMLEARK